MKKYLSIAILLMLMATPLVFMLRDDDDAPYFTWSLTTCSTNEACAWMRDSVNAVANDTKLGHSSKMFTS